MHIMNEKDTIMTESRISSSRLITERYEQKIIDSWRLGEYTGNDCPNCGRNRLCKCPNGKTRCEKCNWVPADNGYCAVE